MKVILIYCKNFINLVLKIYIFIFNKKFINRIILKIVKNCLLNLFNKSFYIDDLLLNLRNVVTGEKEESTYAYYIETIASQILICVTICCFIYFIYNDNGNINDDDDWENWDDFY